MTYILFPLQGIVDKSVSKYFYNNPNEYDKSNQNPGQGTMMSRYNSSRGRRIAAIPLPSVARRNEGSRVRDFAN